MPSVCDRIDPPIIPLREGADVRCLLYVGAESERPVSLESKEEG